MNVIELSKKNKENIYTKIEVLENFNISELEKEFINYKRLNEQTSFIAELVYINDIPIIKPVLKNEANIVMNAFKSIQSSKQTRLTK